MQKYVFWKIFIEFGSFLLGFLMKWVNIWSNLSRKEEIQTLVQ